MELNCTNSKCLNEAILRQTGQEMILSDNRATMAPVWFTIEKYPKFFFSEQAAKRFVSENYPYTEDMICVSSAHNNPHMLFFMRLCIEAAGLKDHPQTKNAYSCCF